MVVKTFIKKKWLSLLNLGIDDSLDFIEKKRIRVVNFIIFLCLPVLFIFWFLSFFNNHFLLANFYIVLTLMLFLVLFFNFKKKGETYRITMIIIITLTASVGSILFDNGQEYYILLIALLSILFYDLKKLVLYLSFLYALIFLATEILIYYITPVEPAAHYFKIINIIIFLSILIYSLYDIKKMYITFLDEILYKKKNLEETNTLMIQQAISLELKNKAIEDLQDKNEELSSIVYHQLRSPVAAFADILSQYLESSTYSNDEFIEMSKLIQAKVKRTLTIVDNLLYWESKGVDSIQPKVLECEINSLIQNALLQVQHLLDKKKLKISYSDTASQIIYADTNHISIILQNVLNNAIKFSPVNEKIKIDIVNAPGECNILITNNGKGINKEHLKKIHSPQHIISSKGTMNETGMGLGLKICKNLVEKNNGSLEIKSEENISTTVIIKLPTNTPFTTN